MEALKSLIMSWRALFTTGANEMRILEAPPKQSTIVPQIFMWGERKLMALSSRILQAGIPSFLCAHSCSPPVLSLPPFLQLPRSSASVEERLDEVDQEESNLLFLGKSRCDHNPSRISLLSQIEACLADYGTLSGTRKTSKIASLTINLDSFNEIIHRTLCFDPAQPRDVLSLRNWVNGTGCLDRKETAYLAQYRELVNLAPSGDSATIQLES
jgi:hypothetical protein